ncbi:MAG: hypothetical protein AAFN11_05390 [Chloroflexota bacterium]
MMDNAVEFTSNDGTITIRTRQRAYQLFIDIENMGVGMPAKEQQ